MDLLIFEMQKILTSGKIDGNIQDFIEESAGKSIDNLLTEADSLIRETLPYFQTTLKENKINISNNVENITINPVIKTKPLKSQYNDTKKVVFNFKNNSHSIKVPDKHIQMSTINDEEKKKKENCSSSLISRVMPEFKVPEMNFMQTQLQTNSMILENHYRLQVMCNRHNKLKNNIKTQSQLNNLKMEEELNYYKLKSNELEKNLKFKEEEIRNWENRYKQLNQYCESFLNLNIEGKLKSYDCQLNELIERNITRESRLHAIISNLLEEIDHSHLQYRIKLSEKNKQIQKYLDDVEKILNSVYKFRKK